MRRAALVAAIALPWGLLALILWSDLQSIDVDFSTGTEAPVEARAAFFADLAYEVCVRPETVHAVADARGWLAVARPEVTWCHAPAMARWIEVQIEPALPFSTDAENATFIGFDAEGCMARWTHTACP